MGQGDHAGTAGQQADARRGATGQVDHAPAVVRLAVGDPHHHRLPCLLHRHPDAAAQRQGGVGRRHGILVEGFAAAGTPPLVTAAIPGRQSRLLPFLLPGGPCAPRHSERDQGCDDRDQAGGGCEHSAPHESVVPHTCLSREPDQGKNVVTLWSRFLPQRYMPVRRMGCWPTYQSNPLLPRSNDQVRFACVLLYVQRVSLCFASKRRAPDNSRPRRGSSYPRPSMDACPLAC